MAIICMDIKVSVVECILIGFIRKFLLMQNDE